MRVELALPRVEQRLDVAALAGTEVDDGELAAELGGIVVDDRGLQRLAERARLGKLAA